MFFLSIKLLLTYYITIQIPSQYNPVFFDTEIKVTAYYRHSRNSVAWLFTFYRL